MDMNFAIYACDSHSMGVHYVRCLRTDTIAVSDVICTGLLDQGKSHSI